MQEKIFHGPVTPIQISRSLMARFNRGNLVAQQFGQDSHMVVQIASRRGARVGGETALTITLEQVEDGVLVQLGRQAWLGIAASLGTSAIWAMRNPFNLLGRLDDIAQDIENLKLSQTVWEVISNVMKAAGASHELSERLRRTSCLYCDTANPVGEPNCIACGAPLGDVQPRTCPNCGFVVFRDERRCPNCGQPLQL